MGRYWRVKRDKSDAAKEMERLGLPNPNERYTMDYLAPDLAPATQAINDRYSQQMMDAQSRYAQEDEAYALSQALNPPPATGPTSDDVEALMRAAGVAAQPAQGGQIVSDNNPLPGMPDVGSGIGDIGASGWLNAIPGVGPTLGLGNAVLSGGKAAAGGIGKMFNDGAPFGPRDSDQYTPRPGITDIPAELYNPEFKSPQDYYDAGLVPGHTPRPPALPKPSRSDRSREGLGFQNQAALAQQQANMASFGGGQAGADAFIRARRNTGGSELDRRRFGEGGRYAQQGRTPFMDAAMQRLLSQQLSGFGFRG
jgi:hypothetical protein